MADGRTVAVRYLGTSLTTRYFTADHLGSIAVVTTETGAVAQRVSYDTWGRQRNPDTWADDTTGSLPPTDQTTRGFTGQEQINDLGLINYNGRIYDPTLGRFLSADPFIQDPANSQSFNRYTYVEDDPLTLTDPTGYFSLGGLFKDIFDPVQVFHETMAVVRAVNSIPILGEIINIASIAGAAYACGPCAIGVAAANASMVAGAEGGTIGDALKAGLVAGATAAAFYGVGALTTPTIEEVPPISGGAAFDMPQPIQFGTGNFFANVVGHALVGCASAMAGGGSCGSGALSAAAGAVVAPTLQGINMFEGAAISATVGGVTAVLGGGKFANGAATAAFGYLFNGGGGGGGGRPRPTMISTMSTP